MNELSGIMKLVRTARNHYAYWSVGYQIWFDFKPQGFIAILPDYTPYGHTERVTIIFTRCVSVSEYLRIVRKMKRTEKTFVYVENLDAVMWSKI